MKHTKIHFIGSSDFRHKILAPVHSKLFCEIFSCENVGFIQCNPSPVLSVQVENPSQELPGSLLSGSM